MGDRGIRPSWLRLRRRQHQLREAIVIVEQCLEPLVTGLDDFSEDSDVSLYSDSESDVRRWHGTNVIRRARAACHAVQLDRDALSTSPFDLEAVAIALGAPRRSTAAEYQAVVVQSRMWLAVNDEGVRRLENALEHYQLCLIARDSAHAVYWAERVMEDSRCPGPNRMVYQARRRRISAWLRRQRAFDPVTAMSTERCVEAILQTRCDNYAFVRAADSADSSAAAAVLHWL